MTCFGEQGLTALLATEKSGFLSSIIRFLPIAAVLLVRTDALLGGLTAFALRRG
jgi:hypothetical protein